MLNKINGSKMNEECTLYVIHHVRNDYLSKFFFNTKYNYKKWVMFYKLIHC